MIVLREAMVGIAVCSLLQVVLRSRAEYETSVTRRDGLVSVETGARKITESPHKLSPIHRADSFGNIFDKGEVFLSAKRLQSGAVCRHTESVGDDQGARLRGNFGRVLLHLRI